MITDRAKIVECLKEEDAFYLISHMQPDGDSIGSLLALGEGLLKKGKNVKLFNPGQVPRKFSFLKGADLVQNEVLINDPTIPVVVLDSSDPERLGIFRDAVMKCETIINIDHHVTNQRYGTYNLVDVYAAATGEIIYHILHDLELPLNADIARSLYIAISTDTGSFKYDNTTPDTHRITAALLEHIKNPGLLNLKIFDERPLSFYILLKEALSSLEMYADRKIAVMTLSRDIRERSGATTDELDGIINYPRNIEGVELGILFYVENSHEVKVGFRSKSMDVSVLAGKFNGGGHARAAGCRLYDKYETVKEQVIDEALSMVKSLSF